jgi:hypothetical protein
MNDWKGVPAIVANLIVVANVGDNLRVVFGERFSEQDEPAFHSAVQINREGARLLIDLLQKGLGYSQGGGSQGGPDEGNDSPGVVMGSTSIH